jgi:hypothetical protein
VWYFHGAFSFPYGVSRANHLNGGGEESLRAFEGYEHLPCFLRYRKVRFSRDNVLFLDVHRYPERESRLRHGIAHVPTRYENEIGSWENNSSNADAVLDGTNDHVFEDWYLNLMVKWSNEDPVSQKEIDRNNKIYDFQQNRNPFVDHPEYITLIWVDPSAVVNPLDLKLTIYPNPVGNRLHVSYANSEEATYFIVNMSGQKIKSGVLHTNENNIDVGNYQKGLYLLIIETPDGKFIKQYKFLKAS